MAVERNVYTRQFQAEFQITDMVEGSGDGRMVFGRVVPFGETITFSDPYDGGVVKRERFVQGAFSRQAGSWHMVPLVFEHISEGGNVFANTIGYGRTLEERSDGAYAMFRLFETDAPKAKEALENSHKGLSLEFVDMKVGNPWTGPDGVIERRRIHCVRVACVPDPAYSGAQVLAVRQEAQVSVPTPNLDQVRAFLSQNRLEG
jgi:HK97 family phage prohead protease